jgi:TrmH family RNA methyltransferase
VILLGPCADPYDPAAVRASTGAVFAQELIRASPAQLAAWARHRGVMVAGAAPDAGLDYRAARYESPLVLAMGAEAHGLGPELRALCDLLVRIPMVGAADSLNLAIATGLMLYEAFRQRQPVEI